MKKVILGSLMFLTGAISVAVMLAGSMANEWTSNGQISAHWNLSQYGLMPIVYIFTGVALIGIVIALFGVFEKNK